MVRIRVRVMVRLQTLGTKRMGTRSFGYTVYERCVFSARVKAFCDSSGAFVTARQHVKDNAGRVARMSLKSGAWVLDVSYPNLFVTRRFVPGAKKLGYETSSTQQVSLDATPLKCMSLPFTY